MYIHEKEKCWEFSYNTDELIKKLGNIRDLTWQDVSIRL